MQVTKYSWLTFVHISIPKRSNRMLEFNFRSLSLYLPLVKLYTFSLIYFTFTRKAKQLFLNFKYFCRKTTKKPTIFVGI